MIFSRNRFSPVATLFAAFSVAASGANADTSIFEHSKVRTESQNLTVGDALNQGALSGIRTRLRGQRSIKRITLSKNGSAQKTLWTKGDKEDRFKEMGPNTLQCVAALFKKRLSAGTEERIACKFFNPETFIAVLFHKDGVLELQTGNLNSVQPKSGPTPSSLKKNYGVFGFENGNAKWTPQEYAIVDEAFGLLSPRERALMSDVPFVRDHAAKAKRSSAPGTVAGEYLPGRGKHACKIFIFDAFTQNTGIFMGTTERHFGAGTMSLVHEIGHALASNAFRKKQNTSNAAATDISALQTKRDEAYKTYKDAEADYKRKAKTLSVDDANKLVDDVNKKIHTFNALDNQVKKILNKENALVRKYKQDGKPVEVAFKRILSKRKAVTQYGRTSPAESFAEAYMLFKLDPAALKRISAPAHAFFASGKYLDIIDDDTKGRLRYSGSLNP